MDRRIFLKKSALVSMFSFLPTSMIPNQVEVSDWKWQTFDYDSASHELSELGKSIMELKNYNSKLVDSFRTKLIKLYAQAKVDIKKVRGYKPSNTFSFSIDLNSKKMFSKDKLSNELTTLGWDWKREFVKPLSKTYELEGKLVESKNILDNVDMFYKKYEFPCGIS